MARILKCWYSGCPHDQKIHTDTEKYTKAHNNHYYHEECMAEMKDLQYLESYWKAHVGQIKQRADFRKVMMQYVNKEKIKPDYIAHTIDCVNKNNWNLNYPRGLKYYMDRPEVKNTYQVKKLKEDQKDILKYMPKEDFSQAPVPETPVIPVPTRQKKSFSSILRGGRNK